MHNEDCGEEGEHEHGDGGDFYATGEAGHEGGKDDTFGVATQGPDEGEGGVEHEGGFDVGDGGEHDEPGDAACEGGAEDSAFGGEGDH